MTVLYKVYKPNAFANNAAQGYTVTYEGDDFKKATDEAAYGMGVCVRTSDNAVFGEDGWGGLFDSHPCPVITQETANV